MRRLIAWRRGFGRVAGRADLTGELVEEMLATDWSWLLTSLAGNRAVAPSVRLRLAGHPDPTVRWAVASGAAGEPDRAAFERLVADPYRRLRVALAENHDMPADLRARLAGDPDPEVRQALARTWPDLPEGVQRRLLTDRQETVRAAACATYHARLPHPGCASSEPATPDFPRRSSSPWPPTRCGRPWRSRRPPSDAGVRAGAAARRCGRRGRRRGGRASGTAGRRHGRSAAPGRALTPRRLLRRGIRVPTISM